MQRKINLSPSEWEEWRNSAASVYFFNYIQEKANAFRQAAGQGMFKKDTIEATGIEYINAINTAEVCELICSIEYEDTIEEEINENITSGTSNTD